MKQSQNLYEYTLQILKIQFLSGAYMPGQIFPSQRELCMQYNVGITTIRKVLKILNQEGYIHTAQGQPSIVTCQTSEKKYISFLVKRRRGIADAYKGLELLMPVLYREGAKRCGESEFKYFRNLLGEISEQMSLASLYKQANLFMTALLRPLNNQLIMDLELDSENYLHIPYIPIPGMENPFALSAERLKVWMQNAIHQIENRQFEEFHDGTSLLYRASAERVDHYLCALSRYTDEREQTGDTITWFRTKDRCELYARLTMTIIRRIMNGEFDGHKYLPSIPKLMEEYGVMKDTASRAVALLNSLGFARTIDKKGTVALNGTTAISGSIDFSEPLIRERLTYFMNVLQIVALTAGSCAASFSSFSENLALFMEDRLSAAHGSRTTPLSFQILMSSFIQMLPCHSLKCIYSQLDELIIWGHYLQAADESLFPDPCHVSIAMKELVQAAKNHAYLAEAYGNAFAAVYKDVNTVTSQMRL